MQEALDEMIALRRMIQNLLGTFEPRLTKDKDAVSNRGHLHPIKRNIGVVGDPGGCAPDYVLYCNVLCDIKYI